MSTTTGWNPPSFCRLRTQLQTLYVWINLCQEQLLLSVRCVYVCALIIWFILRYCSSWKCIPRLGVYSVSQLIANMFRFGGVGIATSNRYFIKTNLPKYSILYTIKLNRYFCVRVCLMNFTHFYTQQSLSTPKLCIVNKTCWGFEADLTDYIMQEF